MQANRILETALYVDHLGAAEAFYNRVLGLETMSRLEGRHLFFRCGDGVLLLFNPEQTAIRESDVPTHGAHGPGHVSFAMRPEEVEAWREHLRQQDVEIESEIRWPSGGHSFYFRDPAGNSVELATPQTWGLT